MWRLHGRKSIHFLHRGEKLVADATAATDGKKQIKRFWHILSKCSSTKYANAYKRVQPNATMETAFWPYFRLSTSFWCRQETTVLHRFRACSRTDMLALANVLDQELDYLPRIDIP
eukprot:scaffold4494_cov79-Skeletonema_dohrnii-CCMP3373.AAC.4